MDRSMGDKELKDRSSKILRQFEEREERSKRRSQMWALSQNLEDIYNFDKRDSHGSDDNKGSKKEKVHSQPKSLVEEVIENKENKKETVHCLSIPQFEEIDISLTNEDVIQYLDFLREIYEEPNLHHPRVIQNAIRRYEKYWLPLKAKQEEANLKPPLDVAWIWHCHMLAPVDYHKDCMTIAGILVDNLNSESHSARFPWENNYPDEPYVVSYNDKVNLDQEYTQQSSYNLIDATERQKEFYYNVSLPHYRDEKFIHNAISRYKMFLNLQKEHPEQFLVPTYDIDLIRHTHQWSPVAYKKETETYFDNVRHHGDMDRDRLSGSMLKKAEVQTKNLWSKRYHGYSYPFTGTMYRGVSPKRKMADFSEMLFEEQKQNIWKCVFKIESTQLKSSRNIGGKLRLQLILREDNNVIHEQNKVGQVYERNGRYVWDHICSSETLPLSFFVNTKQAYSIQFALSKKSGIPLIKSPTKGLHKFEVELTDVIRKQIEQNKQTAAEQSPVIIDSKLSEDRIFTLNCTMGKVRQQPFTLELQQSSSFETVDIKDIDLDCVPLHQISSNYINHHSTLRVAEYKVQSTCSTDRDPPAFTAKVIHSLPLCMSVIQIIQNSNTVAISHLIGLDQLTDHKYSAMGLMPSRGDRAMLIKSNVGDWGILIAHWTGFQCQTCRNDNNEVNKTKGRPGYLQLDFIDLTENKNTSRQKIFFDGENKMLKLADMKFTLTPDGGSIMIGEDCKELSENIALAMSVLTLFVLCEPRSEVTINSINQGYSVKKGYKPTSGQKDKSNYYDLYSQPWDYKYLVWSGYDEETCSNSHLYVASKQKADNGSPHFYRDKNNDNIEENGDVTKQNSGDEMQDVSCNDDSYWTLSDMINAYCPCSHEWNDIHDPATKTIPSVYVMEEDGTEDKNENVINFGVCPLSETSEDTQHNISNGSSSADHTIISENEEGKKTIM